MAGGSRLKSGSILDSNPSEDKLWTLFNYVFSSRAKKHSSYKFGLIKAILDSLFTGKLSNEGLFISYEHIFTRFAENYWNLVAHYHLKQQHPNMYQSTALENIINQTIEDRALAENTTFLSLPANIQKEVVKKLSRQCSSNVFGALYYDLEGCVYSFDKHGKGISVAPRAYEFLIKYKMTIEKLNYYAWAQFLENVNSPAGIENVLDKLECAIPQRTNLSYYRDILFNEAHQNTCFYCGKKLTRDIDVDHFIPWSFVKDDKLWNFVLACPHCNRSKHDRLPAKTLIPRIEERNRKIILLDDPVVKKDMESYSDDIIPKMWNYADMSGFRSY